MKNIFVKSFKYFDLLFFSKFTLFFLSFYYFNIFYLGVTSPGGKFYSSFLEEHLNYIAWLTNSILHVSNFIDHTFGIHSYLEGAYQIKTPRGTSVTVWLPCLGLGIISFWVAFIIADVSNWKKKLYWCLAGVTAIWFINCWRIAILVLAVERNWYQSSYIDHHTTFNLVAYSIIFLMIWLYYKAHKEAIYNKTTFSSPVY
jgi:exosortase/archaeosortase family protein